MSKASHPKFQLGRSTKTSRAETLAPRRLNPFPNVWSVLRPDGSFSCIHTPSLFPFFDSPKQFSVQNPLWAGKARALEVPCVSNASRAECNMNTLRAVLGLFREAPYVFSPFPFFSLLPYQSKRLLWRPFPFAITITTNQPKRKPSFFG